MSRLQHFFSTCNVFCMLLLFPVQLFAQSSAEYTVTFESTWSAATHPDGFPSNPHFSGLIGATHDSTLIIWEANGLASAGIESMAELGSKSLLTGELNTAITDGTAGTVLSGGGIGVSPGMVSLTFQVTEAHPLVTLVSMLAPSPDWFVGVGSLNLMADGTWIDETAVELYVYDSGTDSGTTYTASNADTQPPAPITRLETPPFLINGSVEPVGVFTFVRTSQVAIDQQNEIPYAFDVTAPYPNPFTQTTSFTFRTRTATELRVEVYDILGRRVTTLFDRSIPGNTQETLSLDGTVLPGGVYLVRFAGRDFIETRRVMLIR